MTKMGGRNGGAGHGTWAETRADDGVCGRVETARGWLSSLVVCLSLALVGLAAPAFSQNLHAPFVIVGDGAVTNYERSQRMAFLRLLRAPGDLRELAVEQLINERLQMAEARRQGVTVTPEEIKVGMAEFAARGGLDTDQLLTLLAQAGIAAETLRDFVESGLVWRKVVQEMFLPKAQITQAEIEAAYAEAVPSVGTKLLLTEILLPASSPESLKASRARADRLSKITTAEEFGDAAKRFSVAPSRLGKGERDWIDIQALPAPVQAALRGLQPGRASRPVVIPDQGVAIYFMRDRETIRTDKVGQVLDYAAFLIPATGNPQDRAAKLRAEVVVCDDLYPIARGLPADQLVRQEVAPGAVPAAYRAELATMDPGEISTRLVSPSGALVFLMLCNRRNDVPESVSRAQIAEALVNQRIGAMANDFLEELKANTSIVYQ